MLRYKGFVGRVEFDADARTLQGEVIGLRDPVTFRASSVEQVEKAFRDAVDEYLAFCREWGQRPEKPFTGHFVVRVEPLVHRDLEAAARLQGKSLNALVGEMLARGASDLLSPMKAGGGGRPRAWVERAVPIKRVAARRGVRASAKLPPP